MPGYEDHEKRSAPRLEMEGMNLFSLGRPEGPPTLCCIRNLSVSGVMVELLDDPAPPYDLGCEVFVAEVEDELRNEAGGVGEVLLEFCPEDLKSRLLGVSGDVVWREDDRLGVRFHTPLPIGSGELAEILARSGLPQWAAWPGESDEGDFLNEEADDEGVME